MVPNGMAKPAPRNRTLTCTPEELQELSKAILRPRHRLDRSDLMGQLIEGDFFDIAALLPREFIDLLILDPPYNLTKDFNGIHFKRLDSERYIAWFQRLMTLLSPMLKPKATAYVCSDWRTSALVFPVLDEHLIVRNRITWEREKGRGAKKNWKNNTEDIWFCTKSDEYHFDLDAVKLKRRVLAPYRVDGKPKDWRKEDNGNYRLTHPSNIWTDLTVPFWSMPENTPHPAQKPEKLVAKLVLASSREGDLVFDPFLGSGTTAVVAQKLGRKWCGIDINSSYLCWTRKRICKAQIETGIQGFSDGVFWERNSFPGHKTEEYGGVATRRVATGTWIQMKSTFYYQGNHQWVAEAIREYINESEGILSPQTAHSPRAVGDALQAMVESQFEEFLGSWCRSYVSGFSRRSMADLAFTDVEGIYSAIDVKTHREGTQFNMPNLTSVERLARFYETDTNVFCVIMIRYSVEGTNITVSDVLFSPIEFLDWGCLTVGALGWGQIQLADSNKIRTVAHPSRRQWMLQLCDAMMDFYPREISKIRSRMDRFESVREYWQRR